MACKGHSQSVMSEETFDILCTTCADENKKVKAVKYCVECGTYCCKSCTDAHKKFPTLKNHNLLEVYQGQQAGGHQPRLLEIPTERCRLHSSKVLDMYCEFHDEVGCSTCFATVHKSCDKSHIHSIPDTIDAIFKLTDCKHTYDHLKETIASLDDISNSQDIRLKKLLKDKKDALDDINTFEKALAAILRKVAETSRNEVEAIYKQLKTEILDEKQRVTSISNNLQTLKDKLDQSEENRAQRFVSSKLAEIQIKEAYDEKTKHFHQRYPEVQLSFTTDQSLMDYMTSLQGIGQVNKHHHNGLYTTKSSKEITIDSTHPGLLFCCLTHDGGQLLVTESRTRKVKRFDTKTMTLIDFCLLNSSPNSICCISKEEAAVACQNDDKIQLISMRGQMTQSRQFATPHECYGIAHRHGKLYVTDANNSMYVYNLTGTRLKTISHHYVGKRRKNLFCKNRLVSYDDMRDRVYVGDGVNGLLIFDGEGNYMSTIYDTDLKFTMGAYVDGRGNVFVTGLHSYNVVQFDENGKKVGTVLKTETGKEIESLSFDKKRNEIYVTVDGKSVKVYDLE